MSETLAGKVHYNALMEEIRESGHREDNPAVWREYLRRSKEDRDEDGEERVAGLEEIEVA